MLMKDKYSKAGTKEVRHFGEFLSTHLDGG